MLINGRREGARVTFTIISIKKFTLNNIEVIVEKLASKNKNKTITNKTVLDKVVIKASIMIATFLLLILLYTNAPNIPASVPFNRHIPTVIKGCIENITAPVGSIPKTTINVTITPKDSPKILPNWTPYKAPPIITGIRLKVIGRPIKLIYVDSNCNKQVIAIKIE